MRGVGPLKTVSPLHVAALHPDAPRVGRDRDAPLGRDPDARRWLVVGQVRPVNPRRGGAGAEARRDEGRDAGPLAGGSEDATQVDRRTQNYGLWIAG